MFHDSKLRQLEPDELGKIQFFEQKPAWFTPKPLDRYEIWIYSDDPNSNFRLFIDKDTGNLFLTDFQV